MTAGLLQELADDRTAVDGSVGSRPLAVPASTNTRLRDLAGARETLRVGEAVVAAEAADGLALLVNEMSGAGCAPIASRSFFSSRSIAFLPRGGSKADGSRKMSMSSENRWIRFQPFDRLVPPLKMTLSPAAAQ